MPKSEQVMIDVDYASVNSGYSAKGGALTAAGQILISSIVGSPTASIAFGANNLKRIYMRKKKAGVGYEYEAVAPSKINEMKQTGYTVVTSSSFPTRTIPNPTLAVAGGEAGSKVLNVKLTASVTYEWNQQGSVYAKVPADARTALGQIDGLAATRTEVVQRASAFIFKEEYAKIPGGTLIGIKGVKARYRYAAPTDLSNGLYVSFADGSKI